MSDADRHRPRKRFGQHFLADQGVIDEIVALVAPAPGDRVLEIGPGQGVLTAPLVASGAEVHAIEIDRDLAAMLRERFARHDNFALHNTDVLSFDFATLAAPPPRWKVVGNLPYNISTPLLMRLLEHAGRFSELVVMVQLEVAERLAAGPGSKAYGRLGIAAQRRAEVRKRFEIGPQAFVPPPKVDSAVVRLVPRSGARDAALDLCVDALVKRAFGARRKTLANALRGVVSPDLLKACGIAAQARAEELAIDDFERLAARLVDTDIPS
ncbi:MAG: 16S rRNA (adenine(1518)-N(6)/adenine(1519)-N(6))-dimethyltransferase RsmA [Gammaproteobacteria bacterium]|nr:16S rRNA (adenine(1518)-N(6)/adenine(1519)-N(6))-dimethyltransferase RsmA [Gammaproteobacteria bacterium]